MNEYDQTKRMLNKIRNLNNRVKNLQEQVENISNDNNISDTNNSKNEEKTDISVINNVEIEIHSIDDSDLVIKDDEKGKFSQLIDDFRTDVTEIVDFGKLDLYDDSAKLNGKLGGTNIDFTLSAGDDNGVYLNNASLLKIDDTSMELINKLRVFQEKFSSVMNELIGNRKEF